MKIPTNEAHLRENLHEAVESLSLVNIIILLVLIRAVQVISWLRPSERDVKALPDPLAAPALPDPSTTPGLDSQLPPFRFGTLPENYPGVASITAGAGPEPESGELTIETTDGRKHTFQDWHLAQERSLRSMAQREPLHWEHVGVDFGIGQSRHRPHATANPVDSEPFTTEILAWALNDCNERLVLIRRPSGEFRIERDHRQYTKGDNTCIMAPQWPQRVLETECERANYIHQHNEYERHRHGFITGYCTPCRDGMLTGAFGVPAISFGGPRNRETARAWERSMADMFAERGSIMTGDVPPIRARCNNHTPESE